MEDTSEFKKFWEYSDSKNYVIDKKDDYRSLRKIDIGTYSEVFEAVNIKTGKRCAVKVLKPVGYEKIIREIEILKKVSGGPNVITLQAVLRNEIKLNPLLIFEYVNYMDYKELYDNLTRFDIRYYMYQLLKAVEYCHGIGVMHRDIKPQNVLIEHENRKLRLVDFGLAESYHVNKEYGVTVGTKGFKGPELLLYYKKYDYAVDMWSLGCLFVMMFLKKEQLFFGINNQEQLLQISVVLGSKDLLTYASKYNIKLHTKLKEVLGTLPFRPWETFICASNEHLVCPEGFDLLYKLLRYDPSDRISAIDALKHPYFFPVTKEHQ